MTEEEWNDCTDSMPMLEYLLLVKSACFPKHHAPGEASFVVFHRRIVDGHGGAAKCMMMWRAGSIFSSSVSTILGPSASPIGLLSLERFQLF
jgi:hypothetical protein